MRFVCFVCAVVAAPVSGAPQDTLPPRAAVAETTTRATGCPTCGPKCQCSDCDCSATAWSWHCEAADAKARAAVLKVYRVESLVPMGLPAHYLPAYSEPRTLSPFTQWNPAPSRWQTAPVYGGSYGCGPAG